MTSFRHRATLCASLLLVSIGCGSENPPARAAVDTLPSGALRVRSEGPTAWAGTDGWRLVEEYRVGGNEDLGRDALVRPQALALAEDGGVYVADSRPAVIKQFDRTGRFVRAIGREGGGPGEYRVAFPTVAGAHLVVHDPQSSRTTVFDTAGAFVRSWTSACCYWSPITADRSGRVPIPAGPPRDSPYRMSLLRYRVDGTLADTLLVPVGEEQAVWTFRNGAGGNRFLMTMQVPLAPSQLTAPHPDGGIVLGWSGAYRVVRSATGRDTSLVIERAAEARPVTTERRRRIVDSMVEQLRGQISEAQAREIMKESDLPSSAAYFVSLAVDGAGRLWVQPDDGGDPAARRFDVFAADGSWLGTVPAPSVLGSYYQTTWGPGDRMATITENEDGLPIVVVYRIDTRRR